MSDNVVSANDHPARTRLKALLDHLRVLDRDHPLWPWIEKTNLRTTNSIASIFDTDALPMLRDALAQPNVSIDQKLVFSIYRAFGGGFENIKWTTEERDAHPWLAEPEPSTFRDIRAFAIKAAFLQNQEIDAEGVKNVVSAASTAPSEQEIITWALSIAEERLADPAFAAISMRCHLHLSADGELDDRYRHLRLGLQQYIGEFALALNPDGTPWSGSVYSFLDLTVASKQFPWGDIDIEQREELLSLLEAAAVGTVAYQPALVAEIIDLVPFSERVKAHLTVVVCSATLFWHERLTEPPHYLLDLALAIGPTHPEREGQTPNRLITNVNLVTSTSDALQNFQESVIDPNLIAPPAALKNPVDTLRNTIHAWENQYATTFLARALDGLLHDHPNLFGEQLEIVTDRTIALYAASGDVPNAMRVLSTAHKRMQSNDISEFHELHGANHILKAADTYTHLFDGTFYECVEQLHQMSVIERGNSSYLVIKQIDQAFARLEARAIETNHGEAFELLTTLLEDETRPAMLVTAAATFFARGRTAQAQHYLHKAAAGTDGPLSYYVDHLVKVSLRAEDSSWRNPWTEFTKFDGPNGHLRDDFRVLAENIQTADGQESKAQTSAHLQQGSSAVSSSDSYPQR